MQAYVFRKRRSKIDSERRELHAILDERRAERMEHLLRRDLERQRSAPYFLCSLDFDFNFNFKSVRGPGDV